MAANTDKFMKAAPNWIGAIGAGGVEGPAGTTIPLISTVGLPDDTAVELMIDRIDLNGIPTPGEMEVVKGIVSGNNLIDCVRGVEGTAQAHFAGAVCEVILTADMWNSFVDAMKAGHTQAGVHDHTAVDVPLAASDTKNAIADTDIFGFLDSASEFILKKCTWSNVKSLLKTYFDTLYATISYVDSKQLDGPTPYIHLGMSGDQTVDNGSTIAFNTIRSRNILNQGTNGVNLTAGKTYKLTSYVNTISASENKYIGLRFYDNTTPIGEVFYSISATSTANWDFKAPGVMFYTPSADTTVYVKVVDDSIGTGQVRASYNCSFIVEQVIGMKGEKGDVGDVSVSDIVFEGWTTPTLLNNWVNYGGLHEPAGYCKDALGFVHLKGLIKLGTVDANAFVLPVGYRPAYEQLFIIMGNGAVGRLGVHADGSVRPQSPTNNAWVQLNGITFKAEQ